MKKITSSIGTEKLKEVFDDVVIKNPYNSVRIIDFAIQLEFYKGFPINELKRLKEDFKSNPIAFIIIRRMVFDYLYMFPTSFERKQKIGEILNISMETQRRIEAKSTIRRK